MASRKRTNSNVIAISNKPSSADDLSALVASITRLDTLPDNELADLLGDVGPKTIARLTRLCHVWGRVASGAEMSSDAIEAAPEPDVSDNVAIAAMLDAMPARRRGPVPACSDADFLAALKSPRTIKEMSDMYDMSYQNTHSRMKRMKKAGKVRECGQRRAPGITQGAPSTTYIAV